MAATKIQFDPSKPLDDLSKIVEQVNSAKDVDRESRQESRVWRQMADRIEEALSGKPESETTVQRASRNHRHAAGVAGLSEAVKAVREMSNLLNPVADVDWQKEDVDNLLVAVRFYMINGAYQDEELARAQAMIEAAGNLSKTRVSSSTSPGRIIEGRPEKVAIYTLDTPEVKIAEQAGNKDSSVGNLSNAVKTYLERNGVVVTDEIKDLVNKTVGTAIRDGVNGTLIGDFAVIRFVA